MDVEMFSFQEILVVYNGISILSLRKDAFSDKAIAMMLLYWVSLEHFCEILEYLLVSNSVDVIVGNFNYDLSKVSTNKILDHLKDYAQVVNEATHISWSLIDHVCVKNTLLKDFLSMLKFKTCISQIMLLLGLYWQMIRSISVLVNQQKVIYFCSSWHAAYPNTSFLKISESPFLKLFLANMWDRPKKQKLCIFRQTYY